MTKNELELLEDWLTYHGHFFGLQNIHVLDGSDDPRVDEIYDRFRPLGLNVHFSSSGLNQLAEEITELMHAHKGQNNFLIKLDTDEFLAYAPKFGTWSRRWHEMLRRRSLRHQAFKPIKSILHRVTRIAHRNKELRCDNFSKFFSELPVTGQRYKASLITWSIPTDQPVPRICRDLTQFTPLQFTDLKTFFHSDSFKCVDLGSHAGVSTNNEGVIDTGLTLVHYHSTSVTDSARRARQVLLSHGYIDPQDCSREQKRKLLEIMASGGALSSHKIVFYLKYLDALESGVRLDPSILNQQHPYFKVTGPARELTLVRSALDSIEGYGSILQATKQAKLEE